jgi:hypothetical protein
MAKSNKSERLRQSLYELSLSNQQLLRTIPESLSDHAELKLRTATSITSSAR